MKARILFVDDDENILKGYRRSLRKSYRVETALGGQAGLAKIRESGPFEVVVSDFKMPTMNGVEFLTEVRRDNPDTVRLMLTGQAEMDAAIGAINNGNIFRFLSKPCDLELLTKTLDQAIKQYRLITAERDILERTLTGSSEVLLQVLSLVSPVAFGRASRMKQYVCSLVDLLGLEDTWQYELAATLSHIGCVSLPDSVLEKVMLGRELEATESDLYERHPEVGSELLRNIPRLETVAGMVGNQQVRAARYDAEAFEDPAVIGGQILYIAAAFDARLSRGLSTDEAVEELAAMPERFHHEIVQKLYGLKPAKASARLLSVTLNELHKEMFFAEDVYSKEGTLLVADGQQVSSAVIARLHSFHRQVGVKEPIAVYVNSWDASEEANSDAA